MVQKEPLTESPLTALMVLIIALSGLPTLADEPRLDWGQVRRSGIAESRWRIRGTGARNNPLRIGFADSWSNDELYVRFRLRYPASAIDTPETGNGEFLVLWLDSVEGIDSSTHSNRRPNLGIHVAGQQNRFMARFASQQEDHGPVLLGDRDYLLVGRLSKTVPGREQPFNQLSLWVDPSESSLSKPDAKVLSSGSVSSVSWLGIGTGLKTESTDKIEVWDIEVADDWNRILDLPRASKDNRKVRQPTVDFVRDVYPILKNSCFECHSGSRAEDRVRLDVVDELLNHVNLQDPENSHLLELIEAGEMPPDGKRLPAVKRRILKTWIAEGLVWSEELLPTPDLQSDHWAFQPIVRPVIPETEGEFWVRNPIDAFIAKRLRESDIEPSPLASAEILERRLRLDLLGLPLSRSDIPVNPITDADDLHRYLDEVIERLLIRPEHGERWARHWLDVARWAESNGHQHNRSRPHAWRYRDWVVDSIREDLSYDRFLTAQIAGDLLKPRSDSDLVATGFLAAARYSGNELDKQIQRNDILVDITNTTARAFLGLTLECAQCHTHRFDPLTLRDYYRFQAFFRRGQPENLVLGGQAPSAKEIVASRNRLFDAVEQRIIRSRRKNGVPDPILVTPSNVVSAMTKAEKQSFVLFGESLSRLPQSWGFYSPVPGAPDVSIAPHEMRWPLPTDPEHLIALRSFLLIRGDVKNPGPEVAAGWPGALRFAEGSDVASHSESTNSERDRLDLSRWMTDPKNPLTARVWVNRIWQWHFGRGIVESSDDFGTQGTPPSHPELLDFLAAELQDHDWSTRHIHRLILGSGTWRRSSRFDSTASERDPSNSLYWRWIPRRLEAEVIRDSVLFAAGELECRIGGPSQEEGSSRRSIYLRQLRGKLPYQQLLFDGSTGDVSCARRTVSTNPLQPLWMLNSDFMQHSVRNLARNSESLDDAFLRILGRQPNESEREALSKLEQEFGLQSVCLAILNSSEFLYMP